MPLAVGPRMKRVGRVDYLISSIKSILLFLLSFLTTHPVDNRQDSESALEIHKSSHLIAEEVIQVEEATHHKDISSFQHEPGFIVLCFLEKGVHDLGNLLWLLVL